MYVIDNINTILLRERIIIELKPNLLTFSFLERIYTDLDSNLFTFYEVSESALNLMLSCSHFVEGANLH